LPWYVSPALFPMLVGLGILALSGLLVRHAARTLGRDGVREALRPHATLVSARNLRLYLILGSIIAYVYVFVPHVDFALATAFFLAVFVFAFHLDREASVTRNLVLMAGLAVVVGAVLALVEAPARGPAVDLLTVAGIIAVAAVNARALVRQGLALKPWWTGLAVALLTPAVVCPVFRYGLLVPLPHEGLVIGSLDALRYALFR